MSKHMDRILAEGVITGLLAPIDEAPTHAARPWPLTLLTGVGAWFAAIPFAVLLLLIGGSERSLSLGIVGAIVLCAAVAVLRTRPPLFMEQFALAGMVAGALVLFMHLAAHGGIPTAARILFVVFAIAAASVPQTWLRALLGAAMGVTAIVSLYSLFSYEFLNREMKLWAVMGVSVAWCLLSALPSRQTLSIQLRAGLEAVSLGMAAAIICAPFWVNDSFFFFEVDGWLDRWTSGLPASVSMQAYVSVAFTLAAATWMAGKWTALRAPWFAIIALVMATFSWCIPSVGVLALICAVSLVSGRRSTAALCAVMLVWWIGSFYYSLQFLLVYKAILLGASGGVLALTAAFLMPSNPVEHGTPAVLPRLVKPRWVWPQRAHAVALLGCAILTLGIVNASIVQKENLANAGQTLFIALAPVDPRSLMQGDYMRLNFAIGAPATMGSTALVGVADKDSVWKVTRFDDGTPLAWDEIKINLSGTPRHPIVSVQPTHL